MQRQAASPVLSIAVLITGNLVGAGILGLPINTGLAGFFPSLAAMLACWALMLGSALVIADQTLKSDDENFDLPSLFGQTLGPVGRWLAIGGQPAHPLRPAGGLPSAAGPRSSSTPSTWAAPPGWPGRSFSSSPPAWSFSGRSSSARAT